jgi:hypothetical protein
VEIHQVKLYTDKNMKGLFSPEENAIVSYGVGYENMTEQENVYTIPDDFEFGKYNYVSEVSGIFNPNGFTLIENNENQ